MSAIIQALWSSAVGGVAPATALRIAAFLVIADTLLTIGILRFIPYTEIDWIAYMQEVGGFLSGERDYVKLRGDTGPLVYPAMFVYIYSALHHLTDGGIDVVFAQHLFACMYIAVVALVLWSYVRCSRSRVPLLALVGVIASRRIHSIFVLRLFNDAVAMSFLWAATACTLLAALHAPTPAVDASRGRRAHVADAPTTAAPSFVSFVLSLVPWRGRPVPLWAYAAAALYSTGVGVKMNLFLFAPAFGSLWVAAYGLSGAVRLGALCAAVQVVSAFPFLAAYPLSYVGKAFELGRVFTHKWSVNLRWLEEPAFVSPALGKALLVVTALVWLMLVFRWLADAARARGAVAARLLTTDLPSISGATSSAMQTSEGLRRRGGVSSAGEVPASAGADGKAACAGVSWGDRTAAVRAYYGDIDPLLALSVSNFVGVALARSLHYQFYCWYFFSIPYLLWKGVPRRTPVVVRVALFCAMEVLWNLYPPRYWSSLALTVLHGILIVLVVPKTLRWVR
eukprot:TRINITY_DN44748_c0_g1_i1.p1 TRINITY_DN44748_c0_g1~~TRINITY_DN44748_c0_g1_i1.p1  ORF type:complete len:509 (+),score=91.66 TRINITY_DN44748_c0_g1_i1:129-1655(+)